MRRVFADTSFFVAILSQQDQHHVPARVFMDEFTGRIVTTLWVLAEVGNFLAAARGGRNAMSGFIEDLRADPRVDIDEHCARQFADGLALYDARADKDWSFTDCTSIALRRRRRLTDVLTADHHFAQAGFRVLL